LVERTDVKLVPWLVGLELSLLIFAGSWLGAGTATLAIRVLVSAPVCQ
jgi:hypothetical protein